MPDKTGVWGALGTPKSVRVITVLMMVYAVVIGALVFGYAKVSGCLATYADRSATSQAVRAEAAAEDRKLNDAESVLADSDRQRYRQDKAAMSNLLVTLGRPGVAQEQKAAAYANLLKVDNETAKVLDANEAERREIRAERRQIEERRKLNPVPPPPSETC